jgi:hypothetical protein
MDTQMAMANLRSHSSPFSIDIFLAFLQQLVSFAVCRNYGPCLAMSWSLARYLKGAPTANASEGLEPQVPHDIGHNKMGGMILQSVAFGTPVKD